MAEAKLQRTDWNKHLASLMWKHDISLLCQTDGEPTSPKLAAVPVMQSSVRTLVLPDTDIGRFKGGLVIALVLQAITVATLLWKQVRSDNAVHV